MYDNEIDCLESDENTISGYLTQPVKKGKTLGFRRKRFYKLDGAVLSKHANEGAPASLAINVQGAEVKEMGKLMFAITLRNEEKITSYDLEKKVYVLSARTERESGVWVWALRAAAQRRLKQYYEVGKVIGEGGFAIVRIGRSLKTKELCAIKTIKKDESYAKLQGREIAIIKNTDHPNIVKTYDVFETKSDIHIVMEYMKGGMLYDAIEDGIIFSEADVVQFMKEILDGILYLHGKGIVHRDLKPENILCTNRNAPLHVKISDFGLSCITNVAELKANQVLMSTMIGTPQFIAPEIARQEPYTEKVDMWALGMLCYNVVAGSLPIDETRDILPQICNGLKLTFPEKVWTSYSPEARSFLQALLCMQPQKRLSPLGSMVHPWLEKSNGRVSTKIAAYGRVSHRISTLNLATRDPRNKLGAASRMRKAGNSQGCALGKYRWKTAFLAISAMNRFKWLVTPRGLDDELDAYDSLTFDEEVEDFGNESDENDVNSANFAFFVKAVRGSDGQQKHISGPSPKAKNGHGVNSKKRFSPEGGPKSFSSLQDSKARNSGSGHSASGKTTWRDKGKSGTTRDGVLSNKTSARSKDRTEVIGGMSPLRKVSKKLTTVADNAGILGPLRKLSRKVARGTKSKADVTDDGDLELSLAELGVADVDENELLLLECEESSGYGIFETKASKERVSKGRSSSHSVGDLEGMSPVTQGSRRSGLDGKAKTSRRR